MSATIKSRLCRRFQQLVIEVFVPFSHLFQCEALERPLRPCDPFLRHAWARPILRLRQRALLNSGRRSADRSDPSTTDSAKPPTRLAITGFSAAMASSAATPRPSYKRRHTKISTSARNAGMSATKPRNDTSVLQSFARSMLSSSASRNRRRRSGKSR